MVCTACFDELGVDGVYKVMKAERLSRKSLTEGVALSLAEFHFRVDGLHECTLGVSFLSLVPSYSNEEIPAFAFCQWALRD
jgi:hypothetical protein